MPGCEAPPPFSPVNVAHPIAMVIEHFLLLLFPLLRSVVNADPEENEGECKHKKHPQRTYEGNRWQIIRQTCERSVRTWKDQFLEPSRLWHTVPIWALASWCFDHVVMSSIHSVDLFIVLPVRYVEAHPPSLVCCTACSKSPFTPEPNFPSRT